MPAISESHAPSRNGSRPTSAVFDDFRRWRERALPHAFYRVAPRFWTPAGLTCTERLADAHRRAAKCREPRLTGMAWTRNRLYLVVAATTASYEHVGRLLHCAALFRDDPDYTEHRGKRVSMLLHCHECSSVVADFAHRHRVRTVTRQASPCAADASVRSSTDA